MQHNKDFNNLGKQVVVGVLATLSFVSVEKLMLKLTKQPLLVFGFGMIAGCLVYKNRQIIIDQTDTVAAAGKNLVLEQKEKFLDLVAETKEDQA